MPGETSNDGAATVKSVQLPINFYASANYYLVVFTTSSASGIELNISSVKYWTKSVHPVFNGFTPDISSYSGPTAAIPNAAKKGHLFYNTDTGKLLINTGDSVTQDWVGVGDSGGQPTAVLYNANPGQPMTWKGADGATKSSIEQFVETADVYSPAASLFASNGTILKITKYPIQATPPATLYRMFGSMAYVEEIPYVNCVGVTNMSGFVRYCPKLKTFPALKMASVENVQGIFEGCESLESVPLLDWSSVTNCGNAFYRCYALKNVGGFTGLAVSVSFVQSSALTRESVLNIFNGLATVSNVQTITLHPSVLALLSSADRAIATDKGWTIN